MYIKDRTEGENIIHGYLRDKFVREIKRSLIIVNKDINKEEESRKELLEKIKKGEFKEIIA